MTKQLQRWVGITGLIFVALVVVSVLLTPNTPNTNASLAKLASFYDHSKQGILHVDGLITGISVFVGVFWFWYFRDWLIATNAAARRLATAAFAGALLFAAGGALAAGVSTALGDAANNHVNPVTLQVLNIMNDDLNNALVGAGVAVLLASVAILVIRYRVLPQWLGWPWFIIAAAALVIGFLGMIGLGVWLIAVNIIILRRASAATPDTVIAGALLVTEIADGTDT